MPPPLGENGCGSNRPCWFSLLYWETRISSSKKTVMQLARARYGLQEADRRLLRTASAPSTCFRCVFSKSMPRSRARAFRRLPSVSSASTARANRCTFCARPFSRTTKSSARRLVTGRPRRSVMESLACAPPPRSRGTRGWRRRGGSLGLTIRLPQHGRPEQGKSQDTPGHTAILDHRPPRFSSLAAQAYSPSHEDTPPWCLGHCRRMPSRTRRHRGRRAPTRKHGPSSRGQGANGVADGAHLADTWSASGGKGIAWKTPIPGLAHSSPRSCEGAIASS